MTKRLLERCARLRDPKNTRKRADQKAIAVAWRDGKATAAEISQAAFGQRTGSAVYVHLALGLKAHHEDANT